MNQERHQAERFLGLEDFHLIERSPQTRTHWDKPTYHKVNSDIVRTAESLDYAIITRDGSSNIFRKETAIRFEPREYFIDAHRSAIHKVKCLNEHNC